MTIREPLVLACLGLLLLTDLGVLRFPGWSLFQSLLSLVLLFKAARAVYRSALDLRRLRELSLSDRHFLEGPWRPVIPLILGFWVTVLIFVWNLRWLQNPLAAWEGHDFIRGRPLLQAFILLETIRTLWKRPAIRRTVQRFLEQNPLRTFFLLYAAAIALGTLLLILPVSLQSGGVLSLVDAFFLIVSAIAVTGLSPIVTADHLSYFGQFILLCFIQLGGLGIVTLSAGIAALTRRRLSLSHSLASAGLQGSPTLAELNRFVRRVFVFTFAAEGIAAVFLFFLLPAGLEGRAFHAVFHSVSAFCNAGFSTFRENLDASGLAAFNALVCVLIVMGGIGFPILFEAYDRLRDRSRRRRPWLPYMVMTVFVSAFLLVVGALGIFLTETWEPTTRQGFWSRLGNAIFYSVSSRTAGFNTVAVSNLTLGSQLLILGLMLVGGSPLSTAGGLKTTTFGVLVTSALSALRGFRWIQFRRSEIAFWTLQESVAICVLYGTITFVSLLVLIPFESVGPLPLLFEIISALSTVGLSMDVTPQLTTFAKLWVCGLMIAGRFGIMAIVHMGLGRLDEQRYRYAKNVYYVG